jgi:hypothetical protein
MYAECTASLKQSQLTLHRRAEAEKVEKEEKEEQ